MNALEILFEAAEHERFHGCPANTDVVNAALETLSAVDLANFNTIRLLLYATHVQPPWAYLAFLNSIDNPLDRRKPK